MRHSHAATTVAALTAGLTAAAILARRSGRRLPATTTAPTPAFVPVVPVPVPVGDGVVLPFLRPVLPAAQPLQSVRPVRCGDSGGTTKSGAPCAARVAAAGRCHHHHQLAA